LNTLTPPIVSATPADHDRAIATLVTAFISDPLIRWMLPEPNQFLTYFSQVLRFFGGGAFQHGSAYRTEDFLAVALWLPPGAFPNEEALGAVLQEAVSEELQEEVFGLLEQVGRSHPEVEHWYLPAIGVDPLAQGMGYGSAMLAHTLEVCDQAHQAAYLESTNPRNVPLYERFGFRAIGVIQSGSSPAITPMLRDAR
jgi:ribosomal protein S18 acetylase RimI-like enzyme